MSEELKITEEVFPGFIKVTISGEIDIYTSQTFKEKLYNALEEHRKDLKVECRELNYIDSTGLGIFVGALKKARTYGRNIYLQNVKDNIRKLFTITGLDKLFVIE